MAVDKATGKQIWEVAAQRLGKLNSTMSVPAVSRIAVPGTAPRSRDVASAADAAQVKQRQVYERMAEGAVKRGRF